MSFMFGVKGRESDSLIDGESKDGTVLWIHADSRGQTDLLNDSAEENQQLKLPYCHRRE